jgi:hypothetical protein
VPVSVVFVTTESDLAVSAVSVLSGDISSGDVVFIATFSSTTSVVAGFSSGVSELLMVVLFVLIEGFFGFVCDS